MDINYLVMNFSEIDKIVWSDILQSSLETLRKSNDGLLTIIKWIGETPSFVSTLDWKSPIYNKEEILVVLQSPEWTEPTPISGTTI
jgi:hypothetical protein